MSIQTLARPAVAQRPLGRESRHALLGLAVLAVLGAGLEKIVLAIGIVLVPSFARVAHAATLALNRLEFVDAARCLGAGRTRIYAATSCPICSAKRSFWPVS